MTFRAHGVPVLAALRPVQLVVVGDLFIGIEMKPALAALLFRARVPGQAERLHATIGHFDQVLLQRVDAERVFDCVFFQLAAWPMTPASASSTPSNVRATAVTR